MMRWIKRRLWRYQPGIGHGYIPRPAFAGSCWKCGAKPGEGCAVE